MRTLLVILTIAVLTPILGTTVILAALFGVRDRAGSVYDWVPRFWSRAILFAAGAKVRLHGAERMSTGEPRIYASNHVSWFDVWALAATLRRYKFIGKAELFRIPLFGQAARAAGMIEIERENRKAAFESYRLAADRIRRGASVVVCPEGTRGMTYALRSFKKGPFVLAIAAGVPVVPTIVHGTIHVMPKGSFWIRSGPVDIHFLEPVPTEGLSYGDRDELARVVWERMAAAMRELYGVESPAPTRLSSASV
jgi:1-acyl-sn-glycerol-3-phosphate acyltransferase